jgi:hypothetical protein
MKVLLQNLETLQFFYGGERWGTNAEQALDFEKGERAAQFTKNSQLPNVCIVFKFAAHENRPDVRLPLRVEKHPQHILHPNPSQQTSAPHNS